MKTLKYISLRAFAIAILTLVFIMSAKVQMTDNGYASTDWQFNFPLNSHFIDKASGWGVNLEGGYFLTSNFALGGSPSYHSSHEYSNRQALPVSESGSLNIDQQHIVFQLPFGLATRYAWGHGSAFQPYIGVKLGTQYVQLKSTFNIFRASEDTWGFYVSPEIGSNVYPWVYSPGLHSTTCHSYGTNKSDLPTYSVDEMNNVGLCIGIAFQHTHLKLNRVN